MNTRIALGAGVLALAIAATAPLAATDRAPVGARDLASLVQVQVAEPVSVSVYATGLNNPRGLKFGSNGNLYVAEGGTGGRHSTQGECPQVIPPIGPYTGSWFGGRISRISPRGVRTTITDRLPSSQTSTPTGSLTSGVADVVIHEHTLYALIAGAGCSHGVDGRDNAVVRIGANARPGLVANLSRFLKNHPVQNPPVGDFEPDGTWWSMIALNGYLYAVEPNHGELDRIDPRTGGIRRIADISASQGHSVPTALATWGGDFYVGNLNTFPIVKGSSRVLKITPSGQVSTVANGLTTILGLQFDHRGRMYVLQMSSGDSPDPTPGTGSIVRITAGVQETIVSGLTFPTAMTFGPTGDLFVSNVGFGLPPTGMGQVLRVHLNQ